MNIRSAELLENSLQNAADNIYRNRALAASMQEEAQRNAVEQSFRNAMMQHYANIEQKQADAAALQEQRLENEDNAVEKKYGVMQSMQALAEAQSNTTQGLQELSLDTKLTPAQKTQYFRQSIDSQPQFKAQFLQNPMWNALYDGQGDWEAVAQSVRNYRATNGKNGTPTPPAKPAPDNEQNEREVAAIPGQIANTIAASRPDVPKDPTTGKPSVPIIVPTALSQRNGMMAGQLRQLGDPSATYDAEGLTFGTNADLVPNVSTNTGGVLTSPTVSTNSFTLSPGGLNQDALANVQNTPGGLAVLKSFGPVPDMGNTALNTNGVPTGRPAPSAFSSPADVRAAYQAGKIDKPTATQVLQTQFGLQ